MTLSKHERYILGWVAVHAPADYAQIYGIALNRLVELGLVDIAPAAWPVDTPDQARHADMARQVTLTDAGREELQRLREREG